MIKTVTYLSEAEAVALVPSGEDAMVSVTDPGRQAKLNSDWQSVYRTQFIDAEYDARALQFAGIDWWVASGAFSPDMALWLRDHLRSLHAAPQGINLVCHCHAGQSRSAAIAQYVVQAFGAELLKAQSPKTNQTVLKLLHNPWHFVPEWQYRQLTGSVWSRLVWRLRELLR